MVTHPLAARVKGLMEARDISQTELARRAGCSPKSIAVIIQGKVHRSRLLPAIAPVLGVSVAYLAGETSEAVRPGAAGALTVSEHDLLEKVRTLSAPDRMIVYRLADTLIRTEGRRRK